MQKYDPERAPNPEQWLALDESERIELALRFHRRARVELPDPMMHAMFHAVIEAQIAMGMEPVVATLARLIREGLTRHDAIHAIGLVAAEHMFALTRPGADGSDVQTRYEQLVLELSAEKWRNRAE